jgi:hypothetical protein
MPFVPYGTTVPSLTPMEFSFGGLKFGGYVAGTPNLLEQGGVTGLDLPGLITGDVQRPINDGEFTGYDLTGGRDITIQLIVHAATAALLDTALLNLAAVLKSQQQTETPLFFQKPGGTTYAVMARPRRFNYAVDVTVVQAHGAVVSVQFHCTDGRIYATPTQQTQVSFNATPTNAVCVVGGNTPASPQFKITAGAGNCSPLITTSGASPFNIDLTGVVIVTGDSVIVDTDWQSALYVPAAGASFSVGTSVVFPATWGPFPANTTTTLIVSDAGGGGGTHTFDAQWADAFSAV